MSPEQARRLLAGWADVVATWSSECTPWLCQGCMSLELATEAAAISYDLAVAEASRQRIREGVAWA